MASLTLKSLPPALHRALKSQAARHKRSLNKEAIALLESALGPVTRLDIDAMLAEEKRFASTLKVIAKPEEVDRFKREGRM